MEPDVHAQQRVVVGERTVEETTYASELVVCNQACVSYLEGQGMTQDEIIELGVKAELCDEFGTINFEYGYRNEIIAFAKLVEEKERDKWMNKAVKMMDTALNAQREADAKICEALEDDGCEWDIQQQCANAIRARGQA